MEALFRRFHHQTRMGLHHHTRLVGDRLVMKAHRIRLAFPDLSKGEAAADAEYGIVTLPNEDCEELVASIVSGHRNRRSPRVHRHGAKASVRLGGCQMTLDVEGVVDGGVG